MYFVCTTYIQYVPHGVGVVIDSAYSPYNVDTHSLKLCHDRSVCVHIQWYSANAQIDVPGLQVHCVARVLATTIHR